MDNPLQTFLDKLKADLNAGLATLPPLEQYEASQELVWPIRSIQRIVKEANDIYNDVVAKSATFQNAEREAAATAERTKLVESKEFITAKDAEAAATAAVNAAREEAARDTRTAIEAERKTADAVATRRAQAVTDKKLPALVAEKLPDALFAADDHAAQVDAIAARVKQLSEAGMTAEKTPDVLTDLGTLPMDDAGKSEFDRRLAQMKSVTAAARGGKPAATPVNPLAGMTASDSSAGGGKVALVF